MGSLSFFGNIIEEKKIPSITVIKAEFCKGCSLFSCNLDTSVIQSEVSQKEKGRCCIIKFLCEI